jgi:hypothetical protein
MRYKAKKLSCSKSRQYSSLKQIDPSWSEKERNFHTILPEKYTFGSSEGGNLKGSSNFTSPVGFSERKTKEGLNREKNCFSDNSRKLNEIKEGVRFFGEERTASGPSATCQKEEKRFR